jgi:ornithine carbamoyltransferase
MIDRKKHLLRLADWSEERILETIDIASRLKTEVHSGQYSDRFKGQTLGMFFEKP